MLKWILFGFGFGDVSVMRTMFRFSLFKLFVLFTIVAIVLGLGGKRQYSAKFQRIGIDALRSDSRASNGPGGRFKSLEAEVELFYDFESEFELKKSYESFLRRAKGSGSCQPVGLSEWFGVDFCHKIERVNFGREVTGQDVKYLKMFDGLKRLELGSGISNKEVRDQIGDLYSLEELTMTRFSAPDLSGLKRLKELSFENSYQWDLTLNQKSLRRIGQSRSLETIKIDCDIEEGAWETFPEMETVKELSWSQSRRGNRGLEFLKKFPNLVKLNLSGPFEIDDDSLEALGSLVQLESLVLKSHANRESRTKLHPFAFFRSEAQVPRPTVDWSLLSGIKKLKLVVLEFDDLSDQAVGEICSTNKGIEFLSIRATNVGNQGMDFIEQLPALKKLRTGQNMVTRSGIEGFEKARPECEIVW